jgi:P27 family predicted phage terminase small subunit
MGRKPVPTALRILKGNPGGRPLPADEPKPPMRIPEVPEHLCDDAKREWYRVCPTLHEIGVLTVADRSVLAAYCTSYALWEKAWRAIRKLEDPDKLGSGLITKTTNGNYIQNPLIGTANKAAGDMVKYASELGMTPAARSRVKAGPMGERDEREKFFD